MLLDEQFVEVQALYDKGGSYLREFDKDNEDDQILATEILEGLLLDRESRSTLESKWARRWSTLSEGQVKWQRALYQWCVLRLSKQARI